MTEIDPPPPQIKGQVIGFLDSFMRGLLAMTRGTDGLEIGNVIAASASLRHDVIDFTRHGDAPFSGANLA